MVNGTTTRQPFKASGPARTGQRHITANEQISSAQGLDGKKVNGQRLAGPQLLSYPQC